MWGINLLPLWTLAQTCMLIRMNLATIDSNSFSRNFGFNFHHPWWLCDTQTAHKTRELRILWPYIYSQDNLTHSFAKMCPDRWAICCQAAITLGANIGTFAPCTLQLLKSSTARIAGDYMIKTKTILTICLSQWFVLAAVPVVAAVFLKQNPFWFVNPHDLS